MNPQVHDEAADFFVEFRMDGDTPARRRQFDEWLRKSPEHIRAYLQILPGWDDASHLPVDGCEELIAMARGSASVVHLSASREPQTARRWSSTLRARKSLLFLAAASILVMLILGPGLIRQTFLPTYVTKAGEQLTLQLNDGSTISLNTRTRVRLDFSDATRRVRLLEGQALFRVAADPKRPFIVRTQSAAVRALGTTFDVRQREASTIVTVVDGKVAVSKTSTFGEGSPPVLLTANQQATAGSARVEQPRVTDAAVTTAWTHRRLIFDATPLREVIDEFNRYGTRPLIVDPALGGLSITASFGSTDSGSLVRFLETLPDIRVQRSPDATTIEPVR